MHVWNIALIDLTYLEVQAVISWCRVLGATVGREPFLDDLEWEGVVLLCDIEASVLFQ